MKKVKVQIMGTIKYSFNRIVEVTEEEAEVIENLEESDLFHTYINLESDCTGEEIEIDAAHTVKG